MQITIERGDALFAPKERLIRVIKTRLKHVPLVTARTSIWKKTQITIDRGDPLCVQEGSPSMSDVVDIDFRISGLPHSVVKQADNFSCS